MEIMAEEIVLELGFEDDIDYENGTIKNPKEAEKKKEGVDGTEILPEIEKNRVDPPILEKPFPGEIIPPIDPEILKRRKWIREKKIQYDEKRSRSRTQHQFWAPRRKYWSPRFRIRPHSPPPNKMPKVDLCRGRSLSEISSARRRL